MSPLTNCSYKLLLLTALTDPPPIPRVHPLFHPHRPYPRPHLHPHTRPYSLGFSGLLNIVLCGSGHTDFDLAKLAHDVCLRTMQVRDVLRAHVTVCVRVHACVACMI